MKLSIQKMPSASSAAASARSRTPSSAASSRVPPGKTTLPPLVARSPKSDIGEECRGDRAVTSPRRAVGYPPFGGGGGAIACGSCKAWATCGHAVIPAKAGIQSPLVSSKSRKGDPNGSRLSPG
ncbi:hypothetical protein GCM10009075_27230 [Sphingomonas trueperi]